jgi:hypothetical protein
LIFNNRRIVEFLSKLGQLSFISPMSPKKQNLSQEVYEKIDQRLQEIDFAQRKEQTISQLQEDIEQAEAFIA